MCDSHDHGLTRRGLAGLALGGAVSVLGGTASLAAPHADCWKDVTLDALCLTCIDYRLPAASVNAFDRPPSSNWPGPGAGKYDIVALAGASLAATSTSTFARTKSGFWQQVWAAWTLHKIKHLVVLDHMCCGAFKAQFWANRSDEYPYETERAHHLQQMSILKRDLQANAAREGIRDQMTVEFWIFDDPGNPSMVRKVPIS